MTKHITECRCCGALIDEADIAYFGRLPLSNHFRVIGQPALCPINVGLLLCANCGCTQIVNDLLSTDIFTPEYPYLSSASSAYINSWRTEVDKWESGQSLLEIGCNDGCLFQCFSTKFESIVGVEPSPIPFQQASKTGYSVYNEFFSMSLASELLEQHGRFDVVVANNVIAHVPNIKDFFFAIKMCLKPNGVMFCDFSYLGDIVRKGLFDTIYVEHIFYWSISGLKALIEPLGLKIVRINSLDLHGGSLRVEIMHSSHLAEESAVQHMPSDDQFTRKDIDSIVKAAYAKSRIFERVIGRIENRKIIGYGASAKAVTLFAFSAPSVKNRISYVVDKSIAKQGRLFPMDEIEIRSPQALATEEDAVVIVLAWNYFEEIRAELKNVNPRLEVINVYG